MPETPCLRVALDAPLRRCFDYLPPAGCEPARLARGVRVRVPFGRGRRVGLLLGIATSSDVPRERLRRAEAVLDDEPLLSPALLDLLDWAAAYYQHPAGEVVAAALPALLRAGRPAAPAAADRWRATAGGVAALPDLRRAPLQAALLAFLADAPEGRAAAAIAAELPGWRLPARRLLARGYIERCPHARPAAGGLLLPAPPLGDAQGAAVAAIAGALGGFQPCLLHGITGSGKTEVYTAAAAAAIARGGQVLVLVPEIGLTSQTVERFRQRLGADAVAVLHSGLTDGERLAAWLAARSGEVAVVIGTRSAIWTPLARPALLIVDEEHDLAYKQQEGFRYGARDIAVMRARMEGVPVVLGSATPSLETLHNVAQERYRELRLPARAGGARPPRVTCIDVRGRRLDGGLSEALLAAVDRHVAAGGQALLFINRRGYAPVAACTACGPLACPRCDANLVYHKHAGELCCHHCGTVRRFEPVCPRCGGVLLALGQGTERVEERLHARFPERRIVRIDRDTTRAKGALGERLAQARDGGAQILVGTQMLSKGHDFPGVTLVGVLDADSRLYGADFRSEERLAQLLVQVAGRAGRGARAGEVLIQTNFPGHPLFRTLFDAGWAAWGAAALAERRAAGLPPFSALALLRAAAKRREPVDAFLTRAAALARVAADAGVRALGPAPAPMERRAGDYRAHLLLEADGRAGLARLLEHWVVALEALPEGRRVRWSVDVDPQELL